MEQTTRTLLAIAIWAAALAPAAQAGMLYKSVAANGTMIFSDTPPGNDARLIEQRELSPSGSLGAPRQGPVAPPDAAQLIESDDAIARASQQVDAAEHALALARRGTWSPRDGLTLQQTRISAVDMERIASCQRDLRTARVYLAELMRERLARSAAAPLLVSLK